MPRKGEETKTYFVKMFRHQLEMVPLDKITVASLTRECGLNRQTFYYHFRDMRSFLQYSYRCFVDELFLVAQGTSCKEDGIRAVFDAMEHNPSSFTALLNSSEYSWIRRDLLERTSKFLFDRYGRSIAGKDLSEMEQGFFVRMYALMLFEFAEKRFNGRSYSSMDSFIDSVDTFFGDYLIIDA